MAERADRRWRRVASRLGGRERASRGAVAVEAVLVLPLVLVLLLGVTDLGFLLRDHVAATAYSRVGARTASQLPRVGTVAGHDGGPSFAWDAALAMARSSNGLDPNSIDYVWVYLADDDGFPQGSGSFDDCPEFSCVSYEWDDGAPGQFQYTGGDWAPASINACLGDQSADSVGVYVQVTHPWVAGFFPGGETKISASTVMKFEPLMETSPPIDDPPRPAGCR